MTNAATIEGIFGSAVMPPTPRQTKLTETAQEVVHQYFRMVEASQWHGSGVDVPVPEAFNAQDLRAVQNHFGNYQVSYIPDDRVLRIGDSLDQC